MGAERRRTAIQEQLLMNTGPVTGQELAERLGVSRQVIVQDIALLRTSGVEILATPRGYLLNRGAFGGIKRLIACRHRSEHVANELLTIVRLGGEVMDVIVEHPLYGEITGQLLLSTEKEVEEFVDRLSRAKARLLSSLTDGVHLHTIRVPDLETYKTITSALEDKGYLLNDKS